MRHQNAIARKAKTIVTAPQNQTKAGKANKVIVKAIASKLPETKRGRMLADKLIKLIGGK